MFKIARRSDRAHLRHEPPRHDGLQDEVDPVEGQPVGLNADSLSTSVGSCAAADRSLPEVMDTGDGDVSTADHDYRLLGCGARCYAY